MLILCSFVCGLTHNSDSPRSLIAIRSANSSLSLRPSKNVGAVEGVASEICKNI